MEHLLEDLNEAQREAVTHGGGPLLVIAGAGSGKTRVITRRIAWLIASGLPGDSILGLTFTNKAAREMASRVEALLPGCRVRLSTFHSACARFLRHCGTRLGYGHDFTIYDTQDRNALIKFLMKEQGIPAKEIKPSWLGARISRLKNQGLGPGDSWVDGGEAADRYLGRIFPPYEEAMKSMNAMDFDDLLLNFLEVLEEHPEERERYRSRFRHILVDEFQDTNQIQYRILKLLHNEDRNLVVVGDPDQSIYSFRGAEIGNIMAFPEDFEGVTVVKLEQNYRSTATILRTAQKVIAHNRSRHEKTLVPVQGEGEPVCLLVSRNANEEVREAAVQVRDLCDAGVDPGEIAVFYRARFLSRALEEVFLRFGLPFQIVGDLGFFERKEIKDLLAFLQVCANPRDRVSFSRILNVPARGIGKVSEERIFEEAFRLGLAPAELLRRGVTVPGLRGKAVQGCKELGKLLEEAREMSLVSVEKTLEFFLGRTDYLDFICESGSFLGEERGENVEELLLHARSFDREMGREGHPDMEDMGAVPLYLSQVSLYRSADDVDPEKGVQLMTVHAAKGLEFDHVLVIGLEEGIFPHSRSLERPEDLEEERRLFYVAATRARKRLICLRAEVRETYEGGYRPCLPSRFLEEAGLLDEGGRVDFLLEEGEAGGEIRDLPVFREGDLVHHGHFGKGRILRTAGSGRNSKVEVRFPSGVRLLLLEYARLERVEED